MTPFASSFTTKSVFIGSRDRLPAHVVLSKISGEGKGHANATPLPPTGQEGQVVGVCRLSVGQFLLNASSGRLSDNGRQWHY